MKKFITKWHEKPTLSWMLVIVLLVFIANMQIFWVQTLVEDDYNFYRVMAEGGWMDPSVRVGGYFKLIFMWIVVNIHPFVARSLIMLCVLIPLSILLFQILRRLGYPLPVAFFSATLIHFFPGQYQLPVFITASYTASGLLLILTAFWCGMNFLERSDKNRWYWFATSILIFYFSLSSTELNVPLTAVLIFCLLSWRNFEKNACLLSGTFFVLASYYAYFHIIGSRVSSLAKPFSMDSFIGVAKKFIKMTLSIESSHSYIYIGIASLFSIGILILVFRKEANDRSQQNIKHYKFGPKWELFWRLAFPFLFCLAPLVTMSIAPWYVPRHALYSAVGLYVLLFFVLFESINPFLEKRKNIAALILMTFTIFLAVKHGINVKKYYSLSNNDHNVFVEFVKTKEYPSNAQIVVMGMKPKTHNYWHWSTGYLRYAMQRNDVAGLVGTEFMLYDPFREFRLGRYDRWTRGMHGLKLENPLFLYRYDRKEDELKQLTYFLRWEGDDMKSAFSLYKTNINSGNIELILNKSNGLDDYVKVLDQLADSGINRSDIMWGGSLNVRSKKRLGLK